MTRRHVGPKVHYGLTALVCFTATALVVGVVAPGLPTMVGHALIPLTAVIVIVAWRLRAAFVYGPVAVAVTIVLTDSTGGVTTSAFTPAIYLVVATVAAASSWRSAALSVLLAIAAVSATEVLGDHLAGAFAAGGFVLVFASFGYVLLAREVERIRQDRDVAVKTALARVDDQARDFRLIGAALGKDSHLERNVEQMKASRRAGSVQALRRSFVDTLEATRVATKSDTALLFLLDGDGDRVRLAECVCAEGASPSIVEGTSVRDEGAIAAVLKTKRAINLRPRSGGRGLGYRTRGTGAFLGVPVIDAGNAVGVLAVDRIAVDSFDDRDETILDALAAAVGNAVETERIFRSMDRAKYEHERFFEALALLNEALTLEVGAERLAEAVARMHSGDFTLVLGYDGHTHRVLSTKGEAADGLAGASFTDVDGGLVVMAVKNGHALPHVPLAAQADRSKTNVLGTISAPRLASVKVLPLTFAGEALGAVVVGSTASNRALTIERFRMIETVARHGATTLANAKMYASVEAMATTDGLTGLVNHRRFKELLDEAIARASRFTRKVSVVMVDADHFKSVNDTYGHPVGDLVLVRIAKILEREARSTDVVARYGGEEFVLVLDETDGDGAVLVAERIRARIESETIQGAFGRVRVTASLGVSTWAGDKAMAELLEEADQALYAAKHAGRNRVVSHDRGRCALPKGPAIPPEALASEPPQVQA